MMQPIVRWMRLVLPQGYVLTVAVFGVVLLESIYGICLWQNWRPNVEDFSRLRLNFLAMCGLTQGILRAAWFHPALHVDYRRWLELSPWVPNRALPAGPLALVLQDVVAVLILTGLQLEITPHLLAMPVAFLLGYLLTMACVHRLIGEWALAYGVWFGLAGTPMLGSRLDLVLAVQIGCYLLTVWAIHRSLRRFPWKMPELFHGQSFKTAADAIKEKRLGWPYDLLQFKPPERLIPLSDGICISLLAGWMEFSVLYSVVMNDMNEAIVLMFVGQFLLFSPLFIAGSCIESFRSPISFWGRIWTLRWIIPAFDRIWLMPLTAGIAALAGHVWLPLYWKPAAMTGYLLAMMVLGPHVERWRLIGQHRITFGWNPSTMAAKDFIEI